MIFFKKSFCQLIKLWQAAGKYAVSLSSIKKFINSSFSVNFFGVISLNL